MSELDEFLQWAATKRHFPYGIVSYWIDAFHRRASGKDMYGDAL